MMVYLRIKYLIITGIFCLLSAISFGQNDTVNIQGVISSSVTSNVHNIPVSVTYYDTLSISILYDTVYTDTLGFYSSSFVNSTVGEVEVRLPSCTVLTNYIQKIQNVPSYSGYVSYTLNFTNYCFSSEFSSFTYTDTVLFNSNAVGGFAPYTYFWDFGDSTPVNNSANPQHIYNTGGPIYSISLLVVDTNLDTTSFVQLLNAKDCIADFDHQQTDTIEISFLNLSTTPNTPNYFWSFGDTTYDNNASPIHVYPSIGNYDVCLNVTDSMASCRSVYCELINVSNKPCKSQFSFTQQNNIVSFINQSTSNSSIPSLQYDWDFVQEQSVQFEPVIVFNESGSLPVRLTILDTLTNCTDTSLGSVLVSNLPVNSIIVSGQILVENAVDNTRASLIGGIKAQNLSVIDTMTTFKGYYSFIVDQNSVYFVKGEVNAGHPDIGNIVPRYYESGFLWEDARSIVVSNGSVKNNNIHLNLKKPNLGSSKISGKVVRHSGSASIPNAPVEEVMMVLTNANDEPLATDYTKSDGTYSFSKLGLHNYKVYASIPGKHAYASAVSIVQNAQQIDNVDFTLYDNYIQTVQDHNELIVSSLYPNPSGGEIFLRLEQTMDNDIEWKVIDVEGRSLKQGKIDFDIERTYKLDVNGIKSGFYILILTSINGEKHLPFIIDK